MFDFYFCSPIFPLFLFPNFFLLSYFIVFVFLFSFVWFFVCGCLQGTLITFGSIVKTHVVCLGATPVNLLNDISSFFLSLFLFFLCFFLRFFPLFLQQSQTTRFTFFGERQDLVEWSTRAHEQSVTLDMTWLRTLSFSVSLLSLSPLSLSSTEPIRICLQYVFRCGLSIGWSRWCAAAAFPAVAGN